ncbi:hypothetical protein OCAR_6335 [Afipia carboxidovorans OM5]|nr:hypothetical protein OCAR_6335 [Afipia carboxidovorans OM5]
MGPVAMHGNPEKASKGESEKRGSPRVAGVYPSRVGAATDGSAIPGCIRRKKSVKTRAPLRRVAPSRPGNRPSGPIAAQGPGGAAASIPRRRIRGSKIIRGSNCLKRRPKKSTLPHPNQGRHRPSKPLCSTHGID